MSRGQLPRHPIWFPKMKYRARKRRTEKDEALNWWANINPWSLTAMLGDLNPWPLPDDPLLAPDEWIRK